jgi:hypothetical protein
MSILSYSIIHVISIFSLGLLQSFLPDSDQNHFGSQSFMTSIYIIVDEQVARQRLGKHWFITEYIAAYRQGLYTVYKGARVQGAVANWSDR